MMFVGPDGDVVPSLTESEMREVDRVAIEETCPNLLHETGIRPQTQVASTCPVGDNRTTHLTGLLSCSALP
jgi:hypothetical protein